jgi:flavin reductase (DIM6/NTAB) family NADH-FMN oxidoreductase RutF
LNKYIFTTSYLEIVIPYPNNISSMKTSLDPNTWAIPSPVWVVGSYDKEGEPNVMTAAWVGICNSKPPSIYVSLREATYSYGNIMERKAYTVSIPGDRYLKEADYIGIVSGRNTDKLKDTVLTPVKSDLVDAPYVYEFSLVLECKVVHVKKLGLHTIFVGEIIGIKADEEVLTNGRPDLQKIRPILFSSGDRGYHSVGSRIMDAFTQKNPPK